MVDFDALRDDAREAVGDIVDSLRDSVARKLHHEWQFLSKKMLDAHADVVGLLEAETQRFNSELAKKDAEIEAQRTTIAALQTAHAKLDLKARRMISWITHVQKRLPEFSDHDAFGRSSLEVPTPELTEVELPRGDTKDSNAAGAGPSRSAEGSHSADSDPKDQGGEHSRRIETTEMPGDSNDDSALIDSEVTVASTESVPSQPTLGPPEPPDGSDSDIPQVVFERSLKRKRSRGPRYIKPEPQSPQKSSQNTQPPSATLDLDDVSIPLSNDIAPKATPKNHSSKKRARIAPSETTPVLSLPGSNTSPPTRTGPAIYVDREDSAANNAAAANVKCAPSSHADFTSSFKQGGALQPKSPNPRISTPRSGIRSALVKRKTSHPNIDLFSEDRNGDDSENFCGESPSSLSLEELLHKRTHPDQELTVPQPMVQTPLSTAKARRHVGSAKSSRARALGTPATAIRRPAPAPTTEPGTALRRRDVNELRLEDFKLNPARNQGEDFAFNEVVRNREQRKCLPGCTKPDCCGGTFSKVVQIGGYSTPSRPGLGEAMRGDTAGEDDRLLRNFLGDAAGRLEFMSNVEREEHLHKAKAAAFGQYHGKHRHLHARPPSPVGFWRTDMPSTQENSEDREKAREREHGKIQERWQEAMRPNGLWVFRDECPPTV